MTSPAPFDPSALALATEWLERFQRCVVARDFAAARALFAPDALGFGSRAPVLADRVTLERDQWARVWPAIEDFAFDLPPRVLIGSVAGGCISLALTWSSTGSSAGRPFHRPGRATLVLVRRHDEWLCVHSHYSLMPVP